MPLRPHQSHHYEGNALGDCHHNEEGSEGSSREQNGSFKKVKGLRLEYYGRQIRPKLT